MKEVTSGAHYTTVTVDTAEAVKFSFPSTSLSVEASGGDITVALTDTAQAGDDETITVPDGESRMFIHHRMNIDTYYLTGSGTAKLYASNMGDVNPFSGKSKGGDGGTYSETVLFETHTWHTNDIIPSDALTNYDAFAVEYEITENPNEPRGVLYYLKSTWFDAQGGIKGTGGAGVSCWDIYTDIERTVGYQVKDALLLKCTSIGHRNTVNGGVFVSKIIGIKY